MPIPRDQAGLNELIKKIEWYVNKINRIKNGEAEVFTDFSAALRGVNDILEKDFEISENKFDNLGLITVKFFREKMVGREDADIKEIFDLFCQIRESRKILSSFAEEKSKIPSTKKANEVTFSTSVTPQARQSIDSHFSSTSSSSTNIPTPTFDRSGLNPTNLLREIKKEDIERKAPAKSVPDLSPYLFRTTKGKMQELARLGYSWSTLVSHYVRPNTTRPEMELLQDLVNYRDVIDCQLYETAARQLFPEEFFTVRVNPDGFVREEPDGHHTFSLRFYKLAIYNVPTKGFNLIESALHCTITIQAPGSRTLTSDIDTTLSVTGAQHLIWENIPLLRAKDKNAIDQDGAVRTAMIREFYALSEATYGMTSSTNRDSNVYSDGFLSKSDYPVKFNYNPSISGSPFLEEDDRIFYAPYKLRMHQLELAASMVSLRGSLDDAEWSVFKKSLEVELKRDNEEENNLIPKAAHEEVKKDFDKVCELTEEFHQYLMTELSAHEEKRKCDYPRGYWRDNSPLEGIERKKDIHIAALNDLYVSHLEKVDELKGAILQQKKKIEILVQEVAQVKVELNEVKEDLEINNQLPDSNSRKSERLLGLQRQDAEINTRFMEKRKALTAALKLLADLQNKQQEAQIRANLFANEAYINRSAPYHVVEGMQKEGEVKLSRQTVMGSALQQIGFKLLHAHELSKEGASEELIAYKTAKYGHRVGVLMFGKTKEAYKPISLRKMRMASSTIHVLKVLTPQAGDKRFNDYFTDEEYKLLNAELTIKHGIKDNKDIAESSKNKKTLEHLQQTLTTRIKEEKFEVKQDGHELTQLRSREKQQWLQIGIKIIVAGYNARLTGIGALWGAKSTATTTVSNDESKATARIQPAMTSSRQNNLAQLPSHTQLSSNRLWPERKEQNSGAIAIANEAKALHGGKVRPFAQGQALSSAEGATADGNGSEVAPVAIGTNEFRRPSQMSSSSSSSSSRGGMSRPF